MKVDGSRVSDELGQNASPVTKETCITDCNWFVSLSVFQISWAHARNAFEIKSATKAKKHCNVNSSLLSWIAAHSD